MTARESKPAGQPRFSAPEDAESAGELAALVAQRDRLALELGVCTDLAWKAQLSADLTVVRARIAYLERTVGADSDADSSGQVGEPMGGVR
jgi:hypothetical protein